MVNRPRRSKVVSPMCGGADTTGSPKRAVVRGSFTPPTAGICKMLDELRYEHTMVPVKSDLKSGRSPLFCFLCPN